MSIGFPDKGLTIVAAVLSITTFLQPQDRTAGVAPPQVEERQFGPYDVHALAGGRGVVKTIPAGSRYLEPSTPYTLFLWLEKTSGTEPTTLLAGVGNPSDVDSHFIGLENTHPILRYGAGNSLISNAVIPSSGWHLLAVTFNGVIQRLYLDRQQVAEGSLAGSLIAAQIAIAPTVEGEVISQQHFGGNLVQVTLLPRVLSQSEIFELAQHPPQADMLRYEEASPAWPVQTRSQAGYSEPQDPSIMPHSLAPYSRPQAKPLPPSGPSLVAKTSSSWTLASNWTLASALDVTAGAAALSSPGYDSRRWMVATVPGTVLTTMIDRGIYPDPDFGLNNLVIPESLNKHDYWYRIEFPTPTNARGRRFTLTFNGINYAAEVWFNGHRLGSVEGAFIRGSFDVTGNISSKGRNALAVRISPPPHPGIPQEASILAGPGENGGAMCLDGPTFVATEGWDWIPSIRDRNTGIWQDVVLTATNQILLGDPQVVTHLPLPDVSTAAIDISVPLTNASFAPVRATLRASFEGVDLTQTVLLQPGENKVSLRPSEFPQLRVSKPRLWWPNGYGRPDLYHLKLALSSDGAESDHKELAFGIREITYEISLFDSTGHLRRVEVDPTVAHEHGEDVVDVRHQGMKRTAEYWASSLTDAGEHSSSVKTIENPLGLTDLVLKVNGVRIAARGGNWGMDDSRKRVSREHLEPFFRLHREANVNIIRNWVGQNTEETFFQLADEYGMMVWNDFWASTQNYNVEPQDVPLFLRNARDVVSRFRNHPSIAIWCGRNEGVPQPVLNEGLIRIFREEDGTRYYTPGSNQINLRNSGPYKYTDPKLYYSPLDKGFSVELGISSLSTLESFQKSIPEPDQWPISDAWAYHDWHMSGNGDVHPLMEAMDLEFGSPSNLKDFERKAQMFNYVDHRAIFEGFNQHLWTPNSGRMLWMTQPAWPSNMWQIFSSDYDTNASFYAVKKACEPLHAQLDLSNYRLAVVNTTTTAVPAMQLMARVLSLDNRSLLTMNQTVDLAADATQQLAPLALKPLLDSEKAVLVRLELHRASGELVSTNTYWLAARESDYRRLNLLPLVSLHSKAVMHSENGESVIDLELSNQGSTVALAMKATLIEALTGERILPAYYSDNYIAILPSETTHINIRVPQVIKGKLAISLRGWNIQETVAQVSR